MNTLIEEWENFKSEGEEATHPVDEWFTAREIDPVELVEVCNLCSEEVSEHALAASMKTGSMKTLEEAPNVIASIMFHFGFEVAAKRYGKDIT